MGTNADRYKRIAAAFTGRVRSVPDGAWDNPTPCEGWVARDVVRHIVDWMPGLLLANAGLPTPDIPSVENDPVGAWVAFDGAIRAALDDPLIAAREHDTPAGRFTVEEAIGYFAVGDILVHTWDLARATGLDERLDPDEVHAFLTAMAPAEDAMRASDHYGPQVAVPEDADEQTKLIAFTGRTP